ncbi:MAG: TetR/AcrR family transcriptional regulator [Luteolibacter sp.]
MGRASDGRQRLLDAALNLIWERSYGVVTIDAICDKAGVKKGSFDYFFESKSDLSVAALGENWEKCGKVKWDSIFSASVPPLERITNYLQMMHDTQAELQKEHGQVLGCPCFSLGTEVSTQNEELRTKTQEILQIQLRYLESAIRDAQGEGTIPPGDAAMKAKCLFALFEGAMGQARIQNDLSFIQSLPGVVMDFLGAKRA